MEKSISRVILCALLSLSILLTAALPALADEPAGPSSWAAVPVRNAIVTGMVPQELQGDYQTDMTRGEFAKMAIWFLAVEFDYPAFWADDVLDDATAAEFVDYFLTQSKEGDRPRYQKSDYWDDLPEALRRGKTAEDYSWRELLEAMTPFAESTDPAYADDCLYIHAAYVLGIVNGRDDDTFGPDDPITRQEAAAMLDRVHHVYAATPLEEAELTQYADRDEIGDWAKTSVARMVRYAIMIGTREDTFSPLSHYTREQCILTFYRLFDSYAVKAVNPDILYPTPMDAKLAAVYRLSERQRWDTEDAIVLAGKTQISTMHGGRLETTHLYILYYPEDKENFHITNNGNELSDFSLSEDQQYVYYQVDHAITYRVHIKTGQTERVQEGELTR